MLAESVAISKYTRGGTMKLEEPECEKRPVPRGTRKLRLRAGELCQEESECQEEPEGFAEEN